MSFKAIFSKNKKVLSFEFFPPRASENLQATKEMIAKLADLKPDFMTVTYGAGGGTRSLTNTLTSYILNELNIDSAAHLTCVGHTANEIDQIVQQLELSGITKILALRGDPPQGQEFTTTNNGFACARDLVKHLKANNKLSLAVAGYPEGHKGAISKEADLEYMQSKIDAGAEVVITQLFFDTNFYFEFVEKCRQLGITVPIQPGLMPISNVEQVERFTNMCGATIPNDIRKKLHSLQNNPEAVKDFGCELAIELAEKLLKGGAPGIHFYTLNKSKQIIKINEALRGFFS